MSVWSDLKAEIDGMIARDPAARSRLVVVVCYPSFHAIVGYRLSHWLWKRDFYLLGRFVSQLARWLTGIEIHPGAQIGPGLFIDHGMGVVIGETAEIGRNVTLYHDVTLGGVSPSVDSDNQRDQKRHPTLEDEVIVGSGAQILGPITVGKGARVGANAVVIKDVPPGVTMVGIPAKIVVARSQTKETPFSPYGTPLGDLPDPVARTIEGLMNEIAAMRTQIATLETRVQDTEKRSVPYAEHGSSDVSGEEKPTNRC